MGSITAWRATWLDDPRGSWSLSPSLRPERSCWWAALPVLQLANCLFAMLHAAITHLPAALVAVKPGASTGLGNTGIVEQKWSRDCPDSASVCVLLPHVPALPKVGTRHGRFDARVRAGFRMSSWH